MDIPCPHCAQLNEEARDVCWACSQLLRPKAAPAAPPERSALGPFDVVRTAKTTITINGKQYDRLEDVPEQYRALIAESAARARLGAKGRIVVNGKEYDRVEDVPEQFRAALQAAVTRAAADAGRRPAGLLPSLKLGFGPKRVTLEAGGPLAAPAGFRVEDDGPERRVSWRWFTLGTVGALVFVALWDGVQALVLRGAFSAKHVPASGVFVLLTLAAVGTGMTYATLAYLLNRTSVRVDAVRVSILHGPLPWFGTRDVLKSQLERVWSEKVGRESDDDLMLQPSVTYSVRALLKDGRTLNLVTGLRAPEQALFLEQQIRRPS